MATITVIMGIYNCADTLSEAIDSILSQSFSDWHLIMCDDGSTDSTLDVAESYLKNHPDKMTLIKNSINQGLSVSLNRCLQIANSDYIARMDGDDVSQPNRFELELCFLKNHPEYSIVSSDMLLFDQNGVWGQTHSSEVPSIASMVSETPHSHAASMVKREAYSVVKGYSESAKYYRVADRNLWYKMYYAGFRGANIQKPLYLMRDDRNAATRRKLKYRINGARVGLDVARGFHLPLPYYFIALKPILIGLLPAPVYRFIHRKKRLSIQSTDEV